MRNDLFLVLALLWLVSTKGKTGGIGSLPTLRDGVPWVAPYFSLPTATSYGKSNLSEYRGQSGVYMIKENGRLVYIGHSKTQLYKTIMRHFQEWGSERNRNRIYYFSHQADYRVKVYPYPPGEAELIECQLIQKYRPRDNTTQRRLFECDAKLNPEPVDYSDVRPDETQEFYKNQTVPF